MKRLMLMTAVMLATTGCTTPYWSKHFGEKSVEARQAQMVTPPPATEEERKQQEAARAALPAPAVEGQVSNAVIDRYHNSYGKPDNKGNVYKIGVGTR